MSMSFSDDVSTSSAASDIGSNALSKFPTGLGRACPVLQELNVSCNRIETIAPAEIASCSRLRVLKVDRHKRMKSYFCFEV